MKSNEIKAFSVISEKRIWKIIKTIPEECPANLGSILEAFKAV
jgi:hypothetical protein